MADPYDTELCALIAEAIQKEGVSCEDVKVHEKEMVICIGTFPPFIFTKTPKPVRKSKSKRPAESPGGSILLDPLQFHFPTHNPNYLNPYSPILVNLNRKPIIFHSFRIPPLPRPPPNNNLDKHVRLSGSEFLPRSRNRVFPRLHINRL